MNDNDDDMYTAIWMMPKEKHYGGWPQSGEIDIMESSGKTVSHTPYTLLHVIVS